MAGVIKDIYSVSVDGALIGIKLPRGYYSNIDTICGLTKVADSARPKIILGVSAAIRSGAVVPIGILYKKGNNLVRARIICSVATLQGALAALHDKKYGKDQHDIRGAYFMLNRRLG